MRIPSSRRLRQEILTRLEADQVDRFNVGVRVRRGRVTLTGLVPSHSERLRIRVIANAVAGEGMVDDRLVVRPIGRDWDLADEVIAAGVHDALSAHGLDAGIGIVVHNHTVDVTGEVPDRRARALVRHIVQDAPGVHFVDNDTRVRDDRNEVAR
jgi:osmotically-inducible protein OsmY